MQGLQRLATDTSAQKSLTETCPVCAEGVESTLAADGIKLTVFTAQRWHCLPSAAL